MLAQQIPANHLLPSLTSESQNPDKTSAPPEPSPPDMNPRWVILGRLFSVSSSDDGTVKEGDDLAVEWRDTPLVARAPSPP
jgi:hypothetical protein